MYDVGTIIKGLECCMPQGGQIHKCEECPYLEETDDWPCGAKQMKHDALDALKEQRDEIERLRLEGTIMAELIISFKPNFGGGDPGCITGDVVGTLIRCKDCRYAFFKAGLVPDGHIFCTKPGTERGQAVKKDDWFCADGGGR